MTVFRETLRLRMTQKQAKNYAPPPGVDMMFHDWDESDGTVIVELVTSDSYPDPKERHYKGDIDKIASEELNVVQDGIPRHPRSPKIAKRIDAMIDDPRLQSNAFSSSKLTNFARDVHTVTFSPREFSEVNKVMQSAHLRAIEALGTRDNVIRRFGEVQRREKEVLVKVGEIDSG